MYYSHEFLYMLIFYPSFYSLKAEKPLGYKKLHFHAYTLVLSILREIFSMPRKYVETMDNLV